MLRRIIAALALVLLCAIVAIAVDERLSRQLDNVKVTIEESLGR